MQRHLALFDKMDKDPLYLWIDEPSWANSSSDCALGPLNQENLKYRVFFFKIFWFGGSLQPKQQFTSKAACIFSRESQSLGMKKKNKKLSGTNNTSNFKKNVAII